MGMHLEYCAVFNVFYSFIIKLHMWVNIMGNGKVVQGSTSQLCLHLSQHVVNFLHIASVFQTEFFHFKFFVNKS